MNTDNLTENIIGCALKVSNTLGVGFLERVYENALALELRGAGLQIEQQKRVVVTYRDVVVGAYTVDLLVNKQILLELKTARFIDEVHKAQLMNYLRATHLTVGLILNFGTPKLGVRR